MNYTTDLSQIKKAHNLVICSKSTFGRKVRFAFGFMRPVNHKWTKSTKRHHYFICQIYNKYSLKHY